VIAPWWATLWRAEILSSRHPLRRQFVPHSTVIQGVLRGPSSRMRCHEAPRVRHLGVVSFATHQKPSPEVEEDKPSRTSYYTADYGAC
jgi:hypothetical protein